MATMREVAALAKVSAKTVSRVFNNDPHVAPETKQRVDAALRELSYVPNRIATTFRNGRAPVIGVAVPDIVDPFFSSIAKAAELQALEHDMSVVITSIGDDPAREPAIVGSLLQQALSGLIVAPVANSHGYLAAWSERLPIVFVDRRPVGLAADSFAEDDIVGAHMGTTHLIEHGHTRIAFIADDLAIPTTRDRLEGYRRALTDAGLEVSDDLIVLGALHSSGAEEALAALERARPRATAVFCTNSRAAMGLVPILRGTGLAIATFGDFPLADMLTPAWTVIDQNPQLLGTLAAQRVLDRIDRPNGRYRRKTTLPIRLVERESCFEAGRLEAERRAGSRAK